MSTVRWLPPPSSSSLYTVNEAIFQKNATNYSAAFEKHCVEEIIVSRKEIS